MSLPPFQLRAHEPLGNAAALQSGDVVLRFSGLRHRKPTRRPVAPGMAPMKTKRMCWYQDSRFALLRKPPPLIPKLNVVVAMNGAVAGDDGPTRVVATTD